MSNEISDLYAKLLGETARISWAEIMPLFAKGMVLWVASEQDLVAVAEYIINDDKKKVSALMQQKALCNLSDEHALDYTQRDPELWAVVVAPWVLVQERKTETKH
ncbi:DUF2288 domain-containing protein [Denitrificimonas sp. JX-1]|uniref:DUF2288 domain-containing protein n=1 Tax=Denitrificimonas halotolerans TaxID=3098930 RepID=A0ABU5GP93_9GAMM|nr:DUF2288 domain-containing protein [Denitrificimonas sp. JX-1]MDY7218810.1 DUF2288 domain-containing protein [Denitrificimonas sp. JX-1]